MVPELDWTTLERQALPFGQRPKTCPSWGMMRADGRIVDLASLHQFYIYGGDMLGAMEHPREQVRRVVERAEALHEWIRSEPVVIPPTLLEFNLPNNPMRKVAPQSSLANVTLPRVAAIAELRSHSVARDSNYCFSSMVVIWFQETFGDASPETLTQISAIDWNAHAFDWMP